MTAVGNNTLNEFEGWLCDKLTSLDIDNDVYGSYITGILEENDDDDDSKKEVLAEVLESMVDASSSLCDDVISAWKNLKNEENRIEVKEKNIDDIIAAHVGVTNAQKVQSVDQTAERSDEMDEIKRSVIAMYSSVADDEGDEQHPSKTAAKDTRATHHNTVDSALEIFKNNNSEKIAQAEKMDRLKRKEDSMKKKEQDKADRELQKIKKLERKEKEKKRTQKKEQTR